MVKSFLCIDFGATTVKVAEFEPNETGSLRLKNYALRSMGQSGFAEEREAVVLGAAESQWVIDQAESYAPPGARARAG